MARLLFCCSIQDTLIEVNGLLRARVNGAKLMLARLLSLIYRCKALTRMIF